jgi:hypothetical protein
MEDVIDDAIDKTASEMEMVWEKDEKQLKGRREWKGGRRVNEDA